jgi:hypothetical protein
MIRGMPDRLSAGPHADRDRHSDADKDPLAVELGRRGGRKGGLARAESLTPEERSASARRAAAARWERRAEDFVENDDGRKTRRGRLDERLRDAFIAGAEEHSRETRGRRLAADELQRILRRYPGELDRSR